jgi:hypothetical protein
MSSYVVDVLADVLADVLLDVLVVVLVDVALEVVEVLLDVVLEVVTVLLDVVPLSATRPQAKGIFSSILVQDPWYRHLTNPLHPDGP